jgi:hypothetical protein
MFSLLIRLFTISITIAVLFSCQKDPSSNNTSGQFTYQVDSMRYTFKDEQRNKKEVTSLYVLTYGNIIGENVITKIGRIDTTDNSLFRSVVYVDKEFSYDSKGRLINIYSKSRRKDLRTMEWILGNSQIENYNVRYDYSIPNNYVYPSAITVDIYKDSSATSLYTHDPYTSVTDFNGYFGPGNIAYYAAIHDDTAAFSDNQNILWGGPYVNDPTTRNSLYALVFDKNAYVREYLAYQTPWYFYFDDNGIYRQDQRRVRFQNDSALTKLMAGFIGRKTLKYSIASEVVLSKYQEMSNQDILRGVVNELKGLSLSSTDSTVRVDNKGRITQLVEEINSQGILTKDSQGRISKVTKQITTVRTEFPVGTFRTSQTFEFYYKK